MKYPKLAFMVFEIKLNWGKNWTNKDKISISFNKFLLIFENKAGIRLIKPKQFIYK